MCVVCGSFGLGAEGRLLACAQCGQCYHPFCVGIKVNLLLSLYTYTYSMLEYIAKIQSYHLQNCI